MGDGSAAVALGLVPPQGHRLVVEVHDARLAGGAGRSYKEHRWIGKSGDLFSTLVHTVCTYIYVSSIVAITMLSTSYQDL